MKKICRYLYHVLAHLYWAHFKETVALDLQGHLNTLYAHFIVFVREFNLVDPKETCIMDDLSEILCAPAPPPAPAPAPSSPTSTPSPSSQNHVTERWAGRARRWDDSPGVIEDRGDKERQSGPLPRCQQDLRDLPLPLYFAMTSTNQPQGRGGGFPGRGEFGVAGRGLSRQQELAWAFLPGGKPLPSSLQFKLGTK